ncbi:hypothetical protein I7G86_19450 [Sinorhizobium meliloti]|uniref:Uncharacterized protein n=1 Tax=Sinorhizobium meliloti (strain SM11) TaxID=707241 RepID=F7XAX0_SINMM|nr:hypothetical protein [Sinorhizobium meliloti]AEH81154.1 Hypothetical protein SM11_pC0081 [Sinorhizobium meliloti SM11]ARS67271.1 hypothetical protein SMRU11_08830 [Sinorhizobium meliloti RU11/001]MDE3763934.1 hypothetical protein [Sinorhizobium meliloti]MDE3776296.1 hypothetical protein [Sinorhizobium meliloti]MDE3792802.1 hypothetical protein [Sinorhizobium meliloti]
MKTFRFPEWVRFPTHWIEEKGLASIVWKKEEGSDGTAALLCLIAIAQRVDEHGIARVTYDDLERATSRSRAKVAAGIATLEKWGLVTKEVAGQSTYFLEGFDPGGGWAKLPARALYGKDGAITAVKEFRLRRPVELHALKLYLLFVSRRDRKVNLAVINYETIESYTGLQSLQIRRAITYLSALNLIHVERVKSWESDIGKANAYRLVGLDSYVHRGTTDIEAKLAEGKK